MQMASNMSPAQCKHDASMQLQKEGTAQLKLGKYRDAVRKYEQGRKNLKGLSTAEALELRTACRLNAALCYLKLCDWAACASACTDVLAPGVPSCTKHPLLALAWHVSWQGCLTRIFFTQANSLQTRVCFRQNKNSLAIVSGVYPALRQPSEAH